MNPKNQQVPNIQVPAKDYTKSVVVTSLVFVLMISIFAFIIFSEDGNEDTKTASAEQTPTEQAIDIKNVLASSFTTLHNNGVEINLELVQLAPEEKELLIGEPPPDVGPVSSAPEGVDIPKGIVGPPCEPGKRFWQTGYSFYWAPGMDWHTAGYHPGLDGACVGMVAASASDAVVWRVYKDMPLADWASVNYWVSGRTYITSFKCTDEEAQCFTIYGHLQYPNSEDEYPQAGDRVEAGEAIGLIGNTGNSFGAHLHIGFAIQLENGELYWLDPEELGIIGTR